MLREVQLKPAFAKLYPGIVPARWHTAAAIAGLVKGTRIVQEGAAVEFPERILHPEHFEFRGGGTRRGNWSGMRTRRVDRHTVGHPSRALTTATV